MKKIYEIINKEEQNKINKSGQLKMLREQIIISPRDDSESSGECAIDATSLSDYKID